MLYRFLTHTHTHTYANPPKCFIAVYKPHCRLNLVVLLWAAFPTTTVSQPRSSFHHYEYIANIGSVLKVRMVLLNSFQTSVLIRFSTLQCVFLIVSPNFRKHCRSFVFGAKLLYERYMSRVLAVCYSSVIPPMPYSSHTSPSSRNLVMNVGRVHTNTFPFICTTL